jgi:hypothetical protein
MNSNNNQNEKDENLAIRLFLFLVGIVFFIFGILTYIKVSKSRLRKYYDVDGKTFNKWFQYFCAEVSSIDQFKQKRKITLSDFWKIQSILGKTSDCEVMRKIDIINRCQSDYKTLRKNIKVAPLSAGIDIQTYDRLSVFPPKVCRDIIDWFE